MESSDDYMRQFRGFFSSALSWDDLDRLWQTLRAQADDGWYLYAVGEEPPASPSSKVHYLHFLDEIHALLRKEHDEGYCGIVYANDLQEPSMVKIYDPNNLGSSCGSPGNTPPPLPGWVLSRLSPPNLTALRQTGARRRWWQTLFG